MAKTLCWFEVYDVTSHGLKHPGNNFFIDDYCANDVELLGKYSTKENAVISLKKWAENKGIDYESNVESLRNCSTEESLKLDVLEGYGILIMRVGKYYDLNDKEMKSTDDWAYCTYAEVVLKEMHLDMDI